MTQSRRASLLESAANIAIGYDVMPLCTDPQPATQSTGIVAMPAAILKAGGAL